MNESNLPPLSLYVHLPWCVVKCPYCDFNSHKAGSFPPRGQYVAAIKADIAIESERAAGRRVQTIFLGGGTPSFFDASQIGEILEAAHADLNVAVDAEITMEANPGTLECGELASYRSAGVNRLSLGAQSFDADSLRALGRIHGVDDIYAAVNEAQSAGFNSINIDLMYGLPGQTAAMALADLGKATELEPQHISHYQLTIEPNTVFYSRTPDDMPDDDTSFEMQEACHDHLRDAGYGQYEISAFAKPGYECRHNLNYWTFGDYLAVGAGAHGKVTDEQGTIRRYEKPAHPLAFIKAPKSSPSNVEARKLHDDDILFEYMLNVLRLPQGFTRTMFEQRTGLDFEALLERLGECRDKGLLREATDESWQPTELGLRFLNDLQAQFLPTRSVV